MRTCHSASQSCVHVFLYAYLEHCLHSPGRWGRLVLLYLRFLTFSSSAPPTVSITPLPIARLSQRYSITIYPLRDNAHLNPNSRHRWDALGNPDPAFAIHSTLVKANFTLPVGYVIDPNLSPAVVTEGDTQGDSLVYLIKVHLQCA